MGASETSYLKVRAGQPVNSPYRSMVEHLALLLLHERAVVNCAVEGEMRCAERLAAIAGRSLRQIPHDQTLIRRARVSCEPLADNG